MASRSAFRFRSGKDIVATPSLYQLMMHHPTEQSAEIQATVINADKHQQPRSPTPFNPALLLQERQRFHPNLLRHLLQALEGEVALAALNATPQSV